MPPQLVSFQQHPTMPPAGELCTQGWLLKFPWTYRKITTRLTFLKLCWKPDVISQTSLLHAFLLVVFRLD